MDGNATLRPLVTTRGAAALFHAVTSGWRVIRGQSVQSTCVATNRQSDAAQRRKCNGLGMGPSFFLILRWRFIHVVDDQEIDREFFPFQVQSKLAESRY